MRVTNVGGSLTTALVLSLVAWGVRCARNAFYLNNRRRASTKCVASLLCGRRLLRAKNILRPVERPAKPATRVPSKALYGRLSPAAFSTLVRQKIRERLMIGYMVYERATWSTLGSRAVTVRAKL